MVQFRLSTKQIQEVARQLLAERVNVNPYSVPLSKLVFATNNKRYVIWQETEVVNEKIFFHFYINE